MCVGEVRTYPRKELRILAALAHGGLAITNAPARRSLCACALLYHAQDSSPLLPRWRPSCAFDGRCGALIGEVRRRLHRYRGACLGGSRMVFRGGMRGFGVCQGESGVARIFCGDVGEALGRAPSTDSASVVTATATDAQHPERITTISGPALPLPRRSSRCIAARIVGLTTACPHHHPRNGSSTSTRRPLRNPRTHRCQTRRATQRP